MNVPRWVSRLLLARVVLAMWCTLVDQYGFSLRWLRSVPAIGRFAVEYWKYRALNRNSPFSMSARDLVPALTDKTATTPIEPIYFLQDTWCAARISEQRPKHHVDVGSSIRAMALIAQFVPLIFIDIREIDIDVRNVSYQKGSVLNLPFATGSIGSLSSLCVIEHIGLGRYGDEVDPNGSEKAAVELRRVLASQGDFYISVPVDDTCKIYFNAHRAFTRQYVLALFADLHLVDEQYIYGRRLYPAYDPRRRFGTGLFHFQKR